MGPLGSESLDNWDYLSPARREARDGDGTPLLPQGYRTSAAPLAQQHCFATFILARDSRRESEVSAAKASSAPRLF